MDNPEDRKITSPFRPKTIILCAISRLPEDIAAKHACGYFGLQIEVDPVDFKIVDVFCTFESSLCEKLLVGALLGHEVEEGIKNATTEVEARFFCITKEVVFKILKDLYAGYVEYKKGLEKK